MHIGPVPLRLFDIIDILLVALLMYQVYLLLKGSFAIYIFLTVLSIYVLWLLVKDNLLLLGSILGQIISVGFLAIIIIFQQEIRRFLILIGTRYMSKAGINLNNILFLPAEQRRQLPVNSIIKACINMAKNQTGALIVIKRNSPLDEYEKNGDVLDAVVSSRLIESIFNKNSPLHDGAVIIANSKIRAARAILPVTNNFDLPPHFGLRHRAAIGLTEESDALVIVVSEESGAISLAESGQIIPMETKELFSRLETEFSKN